MIICTEKRNVWCSKDKWQTSVVSHAAFTLNENVLNLALYIRPSSTSGPPNPTSGTPNSTSGRKNSGNSGRRTGVEGARGLNMLVSRLTPAALKVREQRAYLYTFALQSTKLQQHVNLIYMSLKLTSKQQVEFIQIQVNMPSSVIMSAYQ